ncbi:TetR/AcrR family transcriptional regulator [Paractinoplanes brasiliensis]|uniref:TetR family transcriptional regulator n=1 Tax=Paractinoplanes brasiliensis TaxID=52695 RepID=A0A4R6JPF9_9ACTN|nr:TetR/AcrR family transcriptional regulator [Actinoplanes brasiliensis]TDO36495.1 TetR family transcriptional regulator [Actinoplanes brasiliensis]GID32550.1 TetR family transcriptional regulator [Actinoplanes brasiliensis]
MARRISAASADTKRRLADAALDQFHLKGYVGTSVQDLVAAAGAPKGTFYNHFASKEDLAVQTVRRYSDTFRVGTLTDPAAGPAVERLRRHFEALVATGLSKAAQRGCMIANLAGEVPAHSPAVAAAVAEHLEKWTAALTSALDEAKQAGDLKTDLPSPDLAEFIVNAWQGGAVHAKATGSLKPVHSFERMVALLVR